MVEKIKIKEWPYMQIHKYTDSQMLTHLHKGRYEESVKWHKICIQIATVGFRRRIYWSIIGFWWIRLSKSWRTL